MSEFFAVHVASDDECSLNSSGVFGSFKEALQFASTPERKSKARIKKFASPDDAMAFAERGDMSPYLTPPSSPVISEPTVPYPSVSSIQFNKLKRAIEQKDDNTFLKLVTSNPRYLVNIGSDTPAIVVGGFRYNALHIAAKVGNLTVAEYVLNFVKSMHSMLELYGTSEDDVKERSRHLLDCYLNMPEKGALDTPLHLASKFGQLRIVELLLENEGCKRDLKNKEGNIPAEVCCSRCTDADIAELKKSILLLLNPLYISLYRPVDDYYRAIIRPPGEQPADETLMPVSSGLFEFAECKLAASAGPFLSENAAHEFYNEWVSKERTARRSLSRKGAEHCGRRLALRFEVPWLERWNFSSELVNLQTSEGLAVLNDYLVQKKLYPKNLSSKSDTQTTFEDYEFDVFADASDDFSKETYLDDSLGGLVSKMGDLHLNETSLAKEKSNDWEDVSEFDQKECTASVSISTIDDNSEIDLFVTPPSSPEPFYIEDELRCQDDCDLLQALSLVDTNLMKKFGAVSEYVRQVQRVSESERQKWPTSDSPRVVQRRKKRTRE